MAAEESADVATPGKPSVPTLAERVDRCFTTMHPKERGPWKYQEVADGTAAIDPDGSWSVGYLHAIRNGKRVNPSLVQMVTLAKFFHVPLTYFTGEPEQIEAIDAQIELLEALRDPAVKDVALRAGTLTPRDLRAVSALIAQLSADSAEDGPAPRR